jgi:hypothetical protein
MEITVTMAVATTNLIVMGARPGKGVNSRRSHTSHAGRKCFSLAMKAPLI